MILTINNKQYKVQEARTEEECKKGLKGVEQLPQNEGMLFYMDDKKQQQTFNMKDCLIPLDIIFINQDDEIVDIQQAYPNELEINNSTSNLDADDYIAYVLELNINSGVCVGDELEFEDEDEPPVMKVLAPDGSTQFELWGGERIVSRRETKILIKKAKKADASQSDTDFKALGKYIFKVFNKQDNREPEYVPLKED